MIDVSGYKYGIVDQKEEKQSYRIDTSHISEDKYCTPNRSDKTTSNKKTCNHQYNNKVSIRQKIEQKKIKGHYHSQPAVSP